MARPTLKSAGVFILTAYAVSWLVWLGLAQHSDRVIHVDLFHIRADLPFNLLVRLLGNVGPGLAAIAVALSNGGRAEVQLVMRRLVPRLSDSGWVLFAIAVPILSATLAVYWTSPDLTVLRNSTTLSHWLLVFVFNLPFGPLFEEIGWRGYLLPNLQGRFTPAVASLMVGVIWGPWHTPLYARDGGVYLFLFFLYVLGMSVLFSWFFNISGQSLFVTVCLHASFNATVLAILGPVLNAFGIAPFVRLIVIIWVFAAALLLATHGSLAIQQESTVVPSLEEKSS
jgi:uncharacterized protein